MVCCDSSINLVPNDEFQMKQFLNWFPSSKQTSYLMVAYNCTCACKLWLLAIKQTIYLDTDNFLLSISIMRAIDCGDTHTYRELSFFGATVSLILCISTMTTSSLIIAALFRGRDAFFACTFYKVVLNIAISDLLGTFF